MSTARSIIIATAAVLLAVTATKTGNAPASISAAETTCNENLAYTVPHDKIPSPLQSRKLLGKTKNARRNLLQEIILALDAGCTLAELRAGIVSLYPDLESDLDKTFQHSGGFSLTREAMRYSFTLVLEERLIAEVNALDCNVCSRRPISATSCEARKLGKGATMPPSLNARN